MHWTILRALTYWASGALDQGLEANLVNDITRISARGRYFSILPWAIKERLEVGKPFVAGELGA
jgi:hypothetical protein